MDYYAQSFAPQLSSGADQRKSPRKPMRQRVSLGTPEHGIIQGQTRDVSAGGVSVITPVALRINTVCAVRFDLLVDGRLVRFSGHGKVMHCSLAGMEGFRLGMQLKIDDAKQTAALAMFMST